MISRRHHTVFVHIPKVAGQSIETMFLNAYGLNWEQRDQLLLRRKNPGEKGPQRLAHLRARDYVELEYMTAEDFDSYFTFSFVRNPYMRTYSFYTFLGYDKVISFGTFVSVVLPKKLKDDDFFFRTQTDYLYDGDNRLLVDYVGRLEEIDTDIKEVIERSGLTNAELPHVNKSKGEWTRALGLLMRSPGLIPRLAFGQSKKKFEVACTPDLKREIYRHYKEDFINFNYPE